MSTKITPIEATNEPPRCSVECSQLELHGTVLQQTKRCTLYGATDIGEVCVPAVRRMAERLEKRKAHQKARVKQLRNVRKAARNYRRQLDFAAAEREEELRAELAEAKLGAYNGSTRECLEMLNEAGCGKPGTPNTLWAMVKEVITELAEAHKRLALAGFDEDVPFLKAVESLLKEFSEAKAKGTTDDNNT